MNKTYKFKLDTPCLVIDKAKLLHNLTSMQNEVDNHGKKLRPHVKTHKCSHLAQLQINHGAIGICAAKVGEAEVLIKRGVPRVLITSPIVTEQKIQRLIYCLQQDPNLQVVTDSVLNAQALNDAAKCAEQCLQVLVDIDPGVARTGVSFDKALDLGKFIQHLPNLSLRGVQCYAGNLQHIRSYSVRKEKTTQALLRAASVLKQFKLAGLPCEVLTGSGTGTYTIDIEIPEVTEVQPGSYTVMDMEYRLIESKKNPKSFDQFQPAMTLLTTVISDNHDTHVTVDAGTKALYFDPNTKPFIISHPGLHYDWGGFGDEHGKVTADPGVPLPRVGTVLELIVPHCDPTINLFDQFYITDNNILIDVWNIDMRGQSK